VEEADIRAAIEKFRSGEEESAFCELLEMPGDVLPAMTDIFRTEHVPEIRAFLVKVAWERRDKAALALLGEALMDRDAAVWQEALDGLVTFSSPESLQILQAARSRQFTNNPTAKRFHQWLEEAIGQVEFELRTKA
jgi:hypothetical protein